jgi:hypothetical protein
MSTEIVRTNAATMGGLDVMTLGQTLAKSGYFQDAKDAAQCAVKVLAGQEMGIGPVAAMTGIYIVKGRVTLSANLMAAQIKRSGRYNYRVVKLDDSGCEIVFSENGQEVGRSSFSADDAKTAGLWNSSEPWKKTPRNMLFARAMSNGAKWFCPDVFSGPVYTPDELEGADSFGPPPASDKQRNYIAVLQEKLDWTSEQLSVYASEQRVDLAALTQEQASAFIDGMKTLAEERLPPIRQITTQAPDALPEVERLQRDLKTLRECERWLGIPLTPFTWSKKAGAQPLKDAITESRTRIEERVPELISKVRGMFAGASPDQSKVEQLNRYAAEMDWESLFTLSHNDLITMATWLFERTTEAYEEVAAEPAL